MKNSPLSNDLPSSNDIDRRSFIRMLGGGVVVLLFADTAEAQRQGGGGRPKELSAWIRIAEDGTISVFTGKTEVGQNIRTSLSMVVAEELKVPLSAVQMVMADTDLVPWDAGTFGSRTTPDMAPQLRRAAAAAREALIGLAAAEWRVERGTLEAEGGKILRSGSDQSISYGALSKGQQLVATVDDRIPTTPAAEWKVAGKSVPKVNGESFVTGAHQFTTDIRRLGILHGKVLRPPAFGAKLKSVDLSAVGSLEGVKEHRDGDFIGVTAPSSALAEHALTLIKSEWDGGQKLSNAELFAHLKSTAAPGGRGGDEAGSMAEGLAKAAHKLEKTYTLEYIAHAPLEPRAAVAEWIDGKLTIWTGSQRPFGVKDELMREFSLPSEKVRVIVPDTGSGYGGKHSGECAIEAARLAKAAGKPVKLVWTREEEFTWAYFRPAGVMELRSGIDKDGKLTAWEHHNYNSGGAAISTPYDVPNRLIRTHGSDSRLRQGSYRGLASVANCFARESHMDELARAVSMDPLEFRLKNLSDKRLRAVLEAAADRFGWKNRKDGEGRGCGMACGIDKGGYIATCVELEMVDGLPELRRIVTAFECGTIVHPNHVRIQVEGSIVMGIGGALFEGIDFKGGRILNPRFSQYRVPRFSDVPPIDIVLVNRTDLPSAGAGEAPILGIAPAIGNAIFAATGRRHLALPMSRA
ncbi:MAG: molybdopterin cofactor-binding domain-containing protein [Verrucomicrobiota bacterium]